MSLLEETHNMYSIDIKFDEKRLSFIKNELLRYIQLGTIKCNLEDTAISNVNEFTLFDNGN